MSTIEQAEAGVVAAAMAWRDALLADPRGTTDLPPAVALALEKLGTAAYTLAVTCQRCNLGGHVCPGCGADIAHTEHACDNCAPAVTGASVTRVDGTELATPPRGTDAVAWDLAAAVLDTAHEWMKYVRLDDGDEPADARVTWTWCEEGGQRWLSVERINGAGGLTGETRDFTVQVIVRPYTVPPLGPKDDGVLRDELAAVEHAGANGACPHYGSKLDPCPSECASGECKYAAPKGERVGDELIWIPRTWVDVRRGDTIRMPGTDATAYVQTAVHQHWHADPRSSEYQPEPLEWSAVKVRLVPTDGPATGQETCYDMDPAKPIEIQLTRDEAETIELMGWSYRVGMVTA